MGQYERGHAPRIGAVVVFKKFAAMRYGHVAVVARVVNSREVLVDHANWAPHRGRGRGQVSKMVAVTDVSPGNDWTEVRVWNASTRDFGTRTYPTYGFIYPASSRSYVHQASVNAGADAASSSMRRMSPLGDPVLATADRQIAAVLAEDCPSPPPTSEAAGTADKAATPAVEAVQTEMRPAAGKPVVEAKTTEVKPPETKPVETKVVTEARIAETRIIEARASADVGSAPEAKAPVEMSGRQIAALPVERAPAESKTVVALAPGRGSNAVEGGVGRRSRRRQAGWGGALLIRFPGCHGSKSPGFPAKTS